MVWLLVSVPPPRMMLFALLPMVTVPVPLRVVLPAITNSVLLPTPWRLMAPLLVMVPAPKFRPLLLGISKVVPDEIVKPVSVGVVVFQVFTLSITPPELEVKVPPVMLTSFNWTVELVPVASISPDPFAIVEPLNSKVPPAVASMVPLLVVPPLGLIFRAVDWLALMMPLLMRVRSPLPKVPAP